ncbi:MAG: Gfo/Idh/MocA family oxidoreductase [Clostridia bacterium]|nr:Gfo/Idh/MocA family oxidoreductase [Clostridia bacterium]
MSQIITVAILGCGGRGADTYGNLVNNQPDKFKIVCLCDINKKRLEMTAKHFGISIDTCYTDEVEFFKEKRADLLFVTTQDKDHFRHATRGLELGYHLLLEKPITDNIEECYSLLNTQKKYGGKVVVCHVLRYAPAFKKVAELIDDGKIGKLVCIESIEQVLYWHMAHSYVRGNWRNREESSPMIIAKSCHDLDLLQFFAKSKCESISSIGDLTFFKPENAPEGSAKRCLDCKYVETCPYSAKKIYVDRFNKGQTWPASLATLTRPLTAEVIYDSLKESQYGRCVFHCDNNVVDHEETIMTFENGIKASFTMTGFTAHGGRIMTFHGTYGDIILNEDNGTVTLREFAKDPIVWEASQLVTAGGGHGGGDQGLIDSLYDAILDDGESNTSLANSIESHLMGIAAEESRLKNGERVFVHK